MCVRCAVLPALDVKQLVLSKERNGVTCFVSLTDGKVNILVDVSFRKKNRLSFVYLQVYQGSNSGQ